MSAKVINIMQGRIKRTAEERRKRNEQFALVVLSRWSNGGPASGYSLFNAILEKSATPNGPIATPERAAIVLPVLLEVLDEMEVETEPPAA
jgi:hypothetical protein